MHMIRCGQESFVRETGREGMSVFDVPETLTERLRDDARILNKRDRTEAAARIAELEREHKTDHEALNRAVGQMKLDRARIEELEKRATYEETLEVAREYVRDTEALYARITALEDALRPLVVADAGTPSYRSAMRYGEFVEQARDVLDSASKELE